MTSAARPLLGGFPALTARVADGRYIISDGKNDVTVYTERSAPRDIAQLQTWLTETAPEQIPLVVAPYRAEFASLFTMPRNFFFISPVNFAAAPDERRLIANDAALEFFINAIGADDKFSVHLWPQWQAFQEPVSAGVRRLFERAAVRLKTIRHFGRLWQVNFRLNVSRVTADIAELPTEAPDVLVMAGPSLDAAITTLDKNQKIWCADTAWRALVERGIQPQVVFSVDAGFASQEHFAGLQREIRASGALLVCDLIGNAAVQRLPFAARLYYQSSHPLVQQFCTTSAIHLTPLDNPSGNVGGLMLATLRKFFPHASPLILGQDGRSLRGISHARGTAYYRRAHLAQNRLFTPENYLLRLSRRY